MTVCASARIAHLASVVLRMRCVVRDSLERVRDIQQRGAVDPKSDGLRFRLLLHVHAGKQWKQRLFGAAFAYPREVHQHDKKL